MNDDHEKYLEGLEKAASENHVKDFYLWPRTPISNIQAEIWQRCEVSDWLLSNPESRSYKVVRTINDLMCNRLIPENFKLLDICCGDAVILWQVKRCFPFADTFGFDLNAGRLATHPMVISQGVKLFRSTIQRLFRSAPSLPFDVCIMLNTYRGWEAADLNDDEKWLPSSAHAWFAVHSQFTILTVSDEQIDELKDAGFWVTDIGAGEDDSRMILIWPCAKGELIDLWSQQRQS